MSLPVKGQAYTEDVGLTNLFDPQFFLAAPTLEAGDVKISKDNGTLVNIATLPVVSPPGSRIIALTRSAAEMTAERATVVFHDQTVPPEWGDLIVPLPIPVHNADSLMDFNLADVDETNLRQTLFKKGTAIIIKDKDIGDSFLPPNVKVTLREHVP